MTEELKTQWVTPDPRQLEIETLELYHPNFLTSTRFYIVNSDTDFLHYKACPFKIELPKVGESQQDLSIILPSFGFTDVNIVDELKSAFEHPEIPIRAMFRIYLQDTTEPQAEFGWFDLMEINISDRLITGRASRVDLFGRYVGARHTYDKRFKGLWL